MTRASHPPFWSRLDPRYRSLAALSIAATLLGYFADSIPSDRGALLRVLHWAATALAANLAAGFIGAMATVFFIERRLELSRDEERRRVGAVALRDFGRTLETAVTAICAHIIHCTPPDGWAAHGAGPKTVAELFDEGYASAMEWANPAALGRKGDLDFEPPPYAREMSVWARSIPRWFNESLARFGALLDADFLERVEALGQDEYLQQLGRLPATVKDVQPGYVVTVCMFADERRRFLGRLLAVIRAYEDRTGNRVGLPDYVTGDRIAPSAWGSARLAQLPPVCAASKPVAPGPGSTAFLHTAPPRVQPQHPAPVLALGMSGVTRAEPG